MARKNNVTAPNWLILAVILIVAGAAIFFLYQTSGKSISNSGDAIGQSPQGPDHCHIPATCSVLDGSFTAIGDTKAEASAAAIGKCVLGTPAVIERVNSCLRERAAACLANSDCAYWGTGATAGPCTILRCWPLPGTQFITPAGLPGWRELWRCDAGVKVDGSFSCTMI